MPQNNSRIQRRLLGVVFCFALCTVLAVAESVSSYLALMKYEKPITWVRALRQPFKTWYAFWLFSFGILWWCKRTRLEVAHFGRWLARHFAASLVFALMFVTCIAWLIAGERSVHDGSILTFSYLVTKFAIGDSVWFMMMYWMVVFGQLGWSSYQRHREHELEEQELQRQLIEARLDALRMQLNPHFLFNTLHTISALMHENPEAADRVVARLSELLRLNLDQSQAQEVPLPQDALVPFLILRPLVENAVRHGIEQREGIGLSNTRSRLRHLYGEDHEFELKRAGGGGVEVRITIPYRTPTTAS